MSRLLMDVTKKYESDFTFHHDFALTNRICNIIRFSILQKIIYSDHCPVEIICSTTMVPDLHFIKSCSEGLFNYDNCDVNKSIRNPISVLKLDIPKVVASLDEFGTRLLEEDLNIIDVDTLCAQINDGIYKACQENRKIQQ